MRGVKPVQQKMFSLKDKVALVTGASQGIGRDTAVALAEAGAKVAVAARSEEKLAALAKDIVASGGDASAVKMDVADAGQLKAGFKTVTKAIAIEIASRNITANAVAPGFIETPMTDVLTDKVKEDLKTRIPLGRMGSARDVAAAIVFLASDEAGYITGHVLDVNGGMYLA